MMFSTYAALIARTEQLLRAGAIDMRGRPTKDREAQKFSIQMRAFERAFKSLPLDVRRDLSSCVENINGDVLCHQGGEHARKGAYTRRLRAGADRQLLRQASVNAQSKTERIDAVKRAVQHAQAQGYKIKSKTVARALIELGLPEIKTDTVRKLLSEIRRGRAT